MEATATAERARLVVRLWLLGAATTLLCSSSSSMAAMSQLYCSETDGRAAKMGGGGKGEGA